MHPAYKWMVFDGKKGVRRLAELPISVSRRQGKGTRHFCKLVSVCGDIFKTFQALRTRRASSFREKKKKKRKRAQPPATSFSIFLRALCLLNSFYLATIRARTYTIIDFVSFLRGENGRRRNRLENSPEGTPTIPVEIITTDVTGR